jgi:transglutaminase-like putative cysteine protease
LDPRTLRRNEWALTLASALALVGIGRLLWSSIERWNNGPIAVLATAAGVIGVAQVTREWSAGREPRRTRLALSLLLLAWGALAGGAEFGMGAATLAGLTAGWWGRSQALLRWVGALSAGAGVLLGFVAQPVPRVGWFEVAGWFVVLPLLVLLHGEALGSRSRRAVGDDPSRWRWSLGLALGVLWLASLGSTVALPGHGADYPDGSGERLPRERSLGFDDLDRERKAEDAFPSDLQVEGDLSELSDRAFAEVRGAGLDAEGPLYLRALVLDKFTSEGLGGSRFDLRALTTDLSDGSEDGWVRWADPSPDEREAQVVQRVFRLADSDWAPVLTLPGAQALSLSGVVRAETGAVALWSPPVPEWTFTQRWRTGRHWSRVPTDAPAARPSGEGLALPGGPGRRELDRWSATLRSQLGLGERDRPTAVAAIEAVTELFRERGFRYVLEGPRSSGARGLAEFVQRREGYCVHYAATSVFLLRSLGIPARVATGFTSDEFTDGGTRCVVRGRDAHAWVEVDVEGFGWARFDPTPVTDRDAAWEALDQPVDPLESWGADLQRRWERLLAGEWSQFSALLAELARLPLAFLATGYGPWLAVVSLALVVAWRLRSSLRRGRVARGVGANPKDVREQLAAALAGRGLVRGRLDTWPRMGARAASEGRAWSTELQRVAADLDRERFGGIPLGPAESDRVARLVAELQREAAEAKAAEAAASRA